MTNDLDNGWYCGFCGCWQSMDDGLWQHDGVSLCSPCHDEQVSYDEELKDFGW